MNEPIDTYLYIKELDGETNFGICFTDGMIVCPFGTFKGTYKYTTLKVYSPDGFIRCDNVISGTNMSFSRVKRLLINDVETNDGIHILDVVVVI